MRKIVLFHCLILMGLILLGPFSLAQISQPIQNENAATENLPKDSSEYEELHDTKKLNKVLQDYNKNQQKVQQDAEVIKEMESTGELSEEELGKGKVIDPENEKAYHEARDLLGPAISKIQNGQKQDLKKIKYSEAVKTALGPLQKLSERELVDLIKENSKGSAMGVYVERFPIIVAISVGLIKDPQAIPSFVRIAEDQDKLIRFGGLMIATILFGFFLKRFLHKEGRGILASVSVWFIRLLIMSAVRLALIVAFYGDELSPGFKVISRVLF